MSNNLLRENTIRRFMKLANVQSLTDNFIHEKYAFKANDGDDDDDDENPEGEKVNEQEDPEMEEPDMEEPDMEEPDMEEPDMEEPDMDMDDPEPEAGAADISLTEEEAELLIDLGERLKEAMGDEMEMEDDDMEMEDDDMEMEDDMADMEDMDAEEEEEPAGMGMAAAELNESNRSEIVREVLRRVTKRLVSEKTRSRN